MNITELTNIAAAAREHAENLAADIVHASTRIEHIRLTQLALEAERIAIMLEDQVNVQR
jgi:hypothetical protein